MSDEFSFMVARCNPLHLGHIKVITEMISRFNYNNSLMILGSCNTEISLKNPLNYFQRRSLIKQVFPNLKIIGLADQKEDKDWSISLMDILTSVFPNKTPVLYTGSYLDIKKFELETSIKINIIDRSVLKISATEIRRAIYRNCLSFPRTDTEYLRSVLPPTLYDTILYQIQESFSILMQEKEYE